jgi:hypothetical protein
MFLHRSWSHAWKVFSAVLIACLHTRELAAQVRPAYVVVRTYNSFGVPVSTVAEAQRLAKLILDDAGIDASWRWCRTKTGPMAESNDGCDDVVNPRELALRIVRAPKTITDPEVLGYSHVDPQLRKGFLATVFADRVHVMVPRLHVQEGQLLGRVIAHEIGHLLLGTLTHPPTGLMRGHWLMNHPTDLWTFSAVESARMRDRVAARDNAEMLAMALAPIEP